MALKLCISNFKINKIEEMFIKGPKGPAKLFCRYVPKECHHSFRSCLRESRQLSLFSLQHGRSIYIPASLFGKVVPFKLSDIGEGIVEVTIKEWFVKPGDKIAQFDKICEVQSDKASVTISSRYDGVVKKLHYEVDDIAKVGAPLIDIEVDDDTSIEEGDAAGGGDDKPSKPLSSSASSTGSATKEVTDEVADRALTTPAVRRLAKENNVNIQQVTGTGKGGRVLKEDVLAFIEKGGAKGAPHTGAAPPPPGAPKPAAAAAPVQLMGQDVKQKIVGFKKAMFKTMTDAWKVPHFSYCDEIEVGELVKMKADLLRIGQANKVRITFMPFFIKAASLALLKYPELNSEIDSTGDYLIIRAAHNIGIAMDTPSGLVVPNIKNVQHLSIVEVARELNRLQQLGVNGQLGVNDLKDGTITLSNVGAIGGTYTKPILLMPQTVIGGLGKVQVLPRFDDKKNIYEAHIFNVSWSADHRVIDGATMARFSNLWKYYISAPLVLLNL